MEQVISRAEIQDVKKQAKEVQSNIDEYLDKGGRKKKDIDKLIGIYEQVNKDLIKRINNEKIPANGENVENLENQVYLLTGLGYKLLSAFKESDHFPVFQSSAEVLEEKLEENWLKILKPRLNLAMTKNSINC